MYLARSSPTVLTWFMDASARGLQRPHSGTPRPPGASTPSGPAGDLHAEIEALRAQLAAAEQERDAWRTGARCLAGRRVTKIRRFPTSCALPYWNSAAKWRIHL